MAELVIARNPDGDSRLPYLLRLPLGEAGLVLKARETWPRTAKVYCHPSDGWPDEHELEVVERVAVRYCVRRGAAVDLVLDRGRENRSQFVFARARGREVIFWQTARTNRQARPAVSVPTRRASGRTLEILVDSHERYAWKFERQQATTGQAPSPATTPSSRAGRCSPRSSAGMADLVGTMSGGRLRYLLAALADVPPRRWSWRTATVGVQTAPRRSLDHRRGPGRGPGPVPDRAHRVLRDPTAGTGVTYRFLGAAPTTPMRRGRRRPHRRHPDRGSRRARGTAGRRGPGLGTRGGDRDLGPGAGTGRRRRGLPARPPLTSPPVRAAFMRHRRRVAHVRVTGERAEVYVLPAVAGRPGRCGTSR